MLIRIGKDGTAALEDPADFRRFSIRFDAGARGCAPADAALARLARPDGDVAWVMPDALAAMAPQAAEPAWQQGFAGMVAFARSRGWVDAAGRIRAHVEAAP